MPGVAPERRMLASVAGAIGAMAHPLAFKNNPAKVRKVMLDMARTLRNAAGKEAVRLQREAARTKRAA